MELRVLQYFLAVAREGSISAAAESLHLSQPTLSRQLQDLEANLGKKLMIRGNRKVTLTEEGIILKKRAEEILDLVEKTKNEISTSECVAGDIFIGLSETHAVSFVAKAAKKLRELYPDIKYHIYTDNSPSTYERLDKGLLDFGLVCGMYDKKKYDGITLPAFDEWGVLMRKDSPLAQNEYITPNDFSGLPIIFTRNKSLIESISKWAGKESDELNIIATFNTIYNASIMVDAGLGYAICYDKIINTMENSNLTFCPFKPRLKENMYVIWKKHQPLTNAAKKFIEKLTEIADR